jgi:hypothetical protein
MLLLLLLPLPLPLPLPLLLMLSATVNPVSHKCVLKGRPCSVQNSKKEHLSAQLASWSSLVLCQLTLVCHAVVACLVVAVPLCGPVHLA